MPKIVTARDAEQNAASRMREMGFSDAAVTASGPDGGIDVRAGSAVAQVKLWYRPVGTPELQRLFGARGNQRHLKMLFFARSGYARGAISYGDEHEIALFTFDEAGALRPENVHARALGTAQRTAQTAERSAVRSKGALTPYEAERKASLERQDRYFEVGCQIAELRM